MSWDYVCNGNGELEIIVSRWFNKKGDLRQTLIVSGFESYEPVQVEIIGVEDSLAVEPLVKEG